MKKNYKKLYIGAIIIILLVIVVTIIDSKKSTESEQTVEKSTNTNEISQEEISKQNITKTLQGMKERERMEYYFGMFLDYIEEEKYESAYNLLYEEFKTTYFPTLKDFETYIPTIFTEMTNVNYNNIERSGDLYVLWIDISDSINGKPGEKKEIKVVIKENDYNDFVLSFSKI